MSGVLQIAVETVNTTDTPLAVQRFPVRVACAPVLGARLSLPSPTATTRTLKIPKGAMCEITVVRPPLPPYPCEWTTSYVPATRTGGDGDTLLIRNTLACRHSR